LCLGCGYVSLPNWIDRLLGTVSASAGVCDRVGISSSQLQKKFKHAIDFGVSGNCSLENASKFEQAIRLFVQSNNQVNSAKYRNMRAKIFLNHSTKQAVVLTESGDFWTGWRLSDSQYTSFIQTLNMQ
jgi:Colicin D